MVVELQLDTSYDAPNFTLEGRAHDPSMKTQFANYPKYQTKYLCILLLKAAFDPCVGG